MDTPKPRVMKPMMSSPGSGLQQRENLTRQSGTPSTTTPLDTCSTGGLTTIGSSLGARSFIIRA